jgi:hypothetical protein
MANKLRPVMPIHFRGECANMKKLLSALVVTISIIVSPLAALALNFGYYLSFTNGSPATAITAAGHTATQLNNLTPADLAGIDVLWILNGNNGNPDANVLGNLASVANFVNAGGVLSFHDRNVAQGLVDANMYLPGGLGIAFTTNFSTNIDVLTPNTVTNGPAGVINNTTLDGGNFSNHGFASLASLPAGATAVFSNGNAAQIVDFYYSFGAGEVYYSSIPLDFYLLGFAPPAFRTIYAVNEAAFQGELGGANAVPEPASFLLFGLGMLATRLFLRSRKSA